MPNSLPRRDFLTSGLSAGSILGLGGLSLFQNLPLVSAQEQNNSRRIVQLQPDIEPVVRLLEETPRDQLLEVFASEIRKGLSYTEVLAAVQLAGVRNVEPRPSVGFKFHTVLAVNSTHLASLASPPEHRWMPIFWGLDYFKSAAESDVKERGDWTMTAVDDSKLPKPHQATDEFIHAMENWDEAKADAAIAQLARTAGANEIYELMFRFGARDFRSIGHKAIFVANSYRTLQCIGWKHAEPILRSLVYAALMHDGANPKDRDDSADRPWRRNLDLVKTIRPDWRDGKLDSAATEELLTSLRTASPDEACDQVVKVLNAGISPQSIWDALFVMGGELLMRQPGIVALHANTTNNALGYAYRTSSNDETRRLMMLQAAAFVTMFREAMRSRGNVKDLTIANLKEQEGSQDAMNLEFLFETLGSNPLSAARMSYAYLQKSGSPNDLLDAARVLIYRKSRDSHDYKFSSAVLEDYYNVSPEWRNVFLASNVFELKSSTARDTPLLARTQAAFS
ncbi:MAG TPA: hypothetical protein VMM56_09875 [Planctomycetaceae bacterium]|nr:hypothetical protein [Planctomycetaceae bacterium]